MVNFHDCSSTGHQYLASGKALESKKQSAALNRTNSGMHINNNTQPSSFVDRKETPFERSKILTNNQENA